VNILQVYVIKCSTSRRQWGSGHVIDTSFSLFSKLVACLAVRLWWQTESSSATRGTNQSTAEQRKSRYRASDRRWSLDRLIRRWASAGSRCWQHFSPCRGQCFVFPFLLTAILPYVFRLHRCHSPICLVNHRQNQITHFVIVVVECIDLSSGIITPFSLCPERQRSSVASAHLLTGFFTAGHDVCTCHDDALPFIHSLTMAPDDTMPSLDTESLGVRPLWASLTRVVVHESCVDFRGLDLCVTCGLRSDMANKIKSDTHRWRYAKLKIQKILFSGDAI